MKRTALALLTVAFPAVLFSAPISFVGPSEDAVNRIDALVQSGTRDKATLKALGDALQDPATEIRVKERAAWALGELEAKDQIPLLIEGAHHKGLLVRSASLGALLRLRPRSALKTFTDIAQSDPILSMRQNATIGLGMLQWDKAIQPLVDLSSDKSQEIRGAAVLGMAATHSAKNDFTQAIKEMETDTSEYVQARAKLAMDVVKRRTAGVLNQLHVQDSDIRLFAALYFEDHGTKKELKAVEDAWNGEADDDVRFELKKAVTAIKKRAAAAAKTQTKPAATSTKKKTHPKKAATTK